MGSELAALTANATAINSFLGAGGALFSQANGYGFLSTLVPGLLAEDEFQTGIALTPADAQRPRDQDRAFREAQRGKIMPLPKIEQRVIPFMGGADYLGPELRGGTYRLKFMRGGRVIWVDVDAAKAAGATFHPPPSSVPAASDEGR